MPRIKLAHWLGEHKPGDELDVTDAELAALTRDGRIASVVDVSPELADTQETVAARTPAPPTVETGRKRR